MSKIVKKPHRLSLRLSDAAQTKLLAIMAAYNLDRPDAIEKVIAEHKVKPPKG